jgi:hypothetical protein
MSYLLKTKLLYFKMLKKDAFREHIGTFVVLLNSGLNFIIYLFLPLIIGIDSFTFFQKNNVIASLLIVFFSPSIPYILKNKLFAFPTFFVILVFSCIVLFYLSSILLVSANISYLLYILISTQLYFEQSKKRFYFYTLLFSFLQILSLVILRDYLQSFVFTAFLCMLIIFSIENKTVLLLSRNIRLKISLRVLNSLLRPFFSVSLFWQVILIFSEKTIYFIPLTYYSKLSLSIVVAVFSMFSIDLYIKREFKKSDFLILIILSIIGLNALVLFLSIMGKESIEVNHIYATCFFVLSILPSVFFNMISDILIYRISFFVITLLALLLMRFNVNNYFSIVLGLFFLTYISFVSYKRIISLDQVKNI